MGNQLGEGISKPGVGGKEEEKELLECDWKNCDKLHTQKLTYPGKGNFERQGSTLRDRLLDAKMEPWNNGGHGVANKHMYTEQGNPITGRDPEFSYRIQAHHLIPIELMGDTDTLKQNAVLAGWDINSLENGSCHPWDEMDVAVHELQLHLGSHCGSYTKPIQDMLSKYEQDFETRCHGKESVEAQVGLKEVLKNLAAKALRKILMIRSPASRARCWKLHTDPADVLIRTTTEA